MNEGKRPAAASMVKKKKPIFVRMVNDQLLSRQKRGGRMGVPAIPSTETTIELRSS